MSQETAVYEEPKFSKLRLALWPITRFEMKKFLPLSLMMFFILFVYTIGRTAKDAMVVGDGKAEWISFLKIFGVIPASIIFFFLYSKISNKLARDRIFYLIVSSFILFFVVFALVIYPNKDALHPAAETVQSLKQAVPFLSIPFEIFGHWTYTSFYIAAELWGSVCLSLLFWQFTNQITRTHEAKRFYSMLPLLANVALIGAGFLIDFLAQTGKASGAADSWLTTLRYELVAIVICGFAIMAIYRWMDKKVLTDPRYYDAAATDSKGKKGKLKLSIMESLKLIFTSRYLGLIALLVLCYGVSINLVEVTCKDQIKAAFPDKNDFQSFQAMTQGTATGVVTIIFILFGNGFVRRFGWWRAAVITPIVLMITGVLFYSFVIFRGELNWLCVALGATPVLLAAIFGAVQGFLSKATKYSLFDPTKEMAYIPLDSESKAKGKAAVDVVGGRLGKSGGAAIQMILVMAMPAATQLSLSPILAGLMVVMCLLWIFAAGRLSKHYEKAVHDSEAAEKHDTAKVLESEKVSEVSSDAEAEPVGAK